MIPDGHGLPDLSRRTQVIIREQRLIVPGSAELRDEGLGVSGCNCHLRIIDVMNGVAWLIPLDRNQVMALHDRLEQEDVRPD